MKKAFVVAPLLLTLASTSASAGPTEDDSDVTNVQTARSGFSSYSVKLQPAIASDPRARDLVKRAKEISKVKDKAERRKQLAALGPQIAAVRADAIKKAGIDPKEAELKINSLKSLRLARGNALSGISAPGTVISSVTVTSFPTPFGDKLGCPDEDDRFDFGADKKTIKVYAQSSLIDKDCDRIRAGRTGTAQIPSGAKSVKVEIDGKFDIDVASIALGFWSEAHAYFGVRVNVPGATFEMRKMGGGLPDAAISSKTFFLKQLYAKSHSVIPYSLDDFENDMQPGEAGTFFTFTLPPGTGTTIEVTPTVGGDVDADMQGFANLDLDLTVRSVKLTFMR